MKAWIKQIKTVISNDFGFHADRRFPCIARIVDKKFWKAQTFAATAALL
jgi:hypothetical protein